MDQEQINFYLEKTFSQNPSDVAHALNLIYRSVLRRDSKGFWLYFTSGRWTRSERVDLMVQLIQNEMVNQYLALATSYNQKAMKLLNLTAGELRESQDGLVGGEGICLEDGIVPDYCPVYLPLIINDLMFKSKICSELGSKLNHSDYYYQKVAGFATDLLTEKDFELCFDLNPKLLGFENGIWNLETNAFSPAKPGDRVLRSVGYPWKIEEEVDQERRGTIRGEIRAYFQGIGLEKLLAMLGSMLNGDVRQPVIWIRNIKKEVTDDLRRLLAWVLGDYLGELSFGLFRKKRLQDQHGLAPIELIDSTRSRVAMVEQQESDFGSLNCLMLDHLLQESELEMRKPYENAHLYQPQFSVIWCCQKEGVEPCESAVVLDSEFAELGEKKAKKEWRQEIMQMILE